MEHIHSGDLIQNSSCDVYETFFVKPSGNHTLLNRHTVEENSIGLVVCCKPTDDDRDVYILYSVFSEAIGWTFYDYREYVKRVVALNEPKEGNS